MLGFNFLYHMNLFCLLGDVHLLLHQSGKAAQWVAQGKKWVVFFQDTNGLAFRAIPAALGVSAKNQFEVNTLTVPRRAREAVGGMCALGT